MTARLPDDSRRRGRPVFLISTPDANGRAVPQFVVTLDELAERLELSGRVIVEPLPVFGLDDARAIAQWVDETTEPELEGGPVAVRRLGLRRRDALRETAP